MTATCATSDGPWIVDPDGQRDAALVEAWCHRWGLVDATRRPTFPQAGMVVLLSGHIAALGNKARTWVRGSSERRLIMEPARALHAGGDVGRPVPLFQIVKKPARTPRDVEHLTQDYLLDVIEVFWTGFETRLRTGGPLSSVMIGYLLLAARMLADRSPDPSRVRDRAELFLNGLPEESRSTRFVRAAAQCLHGVESVSLGRGGVSTFLSRLCNRSWWKAKLRGDRNRLIYLAHRAATGDEVAWRQVLRYLDLQRGLFRRTERSPLGVWQFHPVLMCAVACRIDSYICRNARLDVSPDAPVDTGSIASYKLCDSGRTLSLGAALLTDAGRRLDPPDLCYQFDFGEWTDLACDESELLRALANYYPDGPFNGERCSTAGRTTLCLRHDVDRPLTPRQVEWHLDFEERLGCRSSWYFKKETFDPDLGSRLLRHGHEVGYHAELCSSGDDGFFGELAEWLGEAPGLTHHGGLGSEFWQGGKSLRAAAKLGARYGELPVGVHPLPAVWPVVTDAEAETSGGFLPLTPRPCKFDVFPDRAQEHARQILSYGGLLIVEQHPDIVSTQYLAFVEGLAASCSERATVRDALDTFFAASRLYGPCNR